MIELKSDDRPEILEFDVAIVAVGYERRCQWVTREYDISGKVKIGLEFGFMKEGSYKENRSFFEKRGWLLHNGIKPSALNTVAEAIRFAASGSKSVSIFIDISSMSREMIANIVLGIESARLCAEICVTIAYAPSKFSVAYEASPIRKAEPITPSLAGWSSRPELPLGVIFGLGCEPNLALGALQLLEPDKAWIFSPRGIDAQFDEAMKKANEHIEDIFNVTEFQYELTTPTITRGRIEALLNSVESDFRIVLVPFGPKIFAWLMLSTVVFTRRTSVGVWAFSSKEQAKLVDRDAEGPVVWHSLALQEEPID